MYPSKKLVNPMSLQVGASRGNYETDGASATSVLALSGPKGVKYVLFLATVFLVTAVDQPAALPHHGAHGNKAEVLGNESIGNFSDC